MMRAVPRYILQAGEVEYRFPGGRTTEPLWIGFETSEPVNLEFLSLHGYDAIPCDGISAEELRSVGVDHFEVLEV